MEKEAQQKKELRARAMQLPMQPGVYLMRDKAGKIIYIGKAKALKNRVSSYFGSDRNHDEKVKAMVRHVEKFEYIVTDSEYEALTLECSLIKQFMPKYNILLKDDKGYRYIRVSNGEWPRVSVAKQIKKEDAEYLGPYYSAFAVKETVQAAQQLFLLPTCTRRFPQEIGRGRPCLNFYIKQCCAPCRGKMTSEEYREIVGEALDFLRGGSFASIGLLTQKMETAAENMEFEKAARLRDRIRAIEKMAEKQKVVASPIKEQDVVAVAQSQKATCVQVFRFLHNRLVDRESFWIDGSGNLKETRTEFLERYYSMRDRIPPRVALDGPIVDVALLEKWLTEKAGRKVSLVFPQKGEQAQLVELCRNNAAEALAQEEGKIGRIASALDELGRLLGLEHPPAYLEAYDISNLAGQENVAGMVVFQDGKPLKPAYRKFKIKTVDGQDDYASMREVICRRFQEYEKHRGEEAGFGRLPDLILLDGGRGHVAAVQSVLEELGIKVPLFGMVKDSRHRTRAISTAGGEIAINASRRAFTLVSEIQNEVHRFAIRFHKQQRKQSVLSTKLTSIAGIGPARAEALWRHFRTLQAIRQAEVGTLAQVKGMTRAAAQNVYDYFHSGDEDNS